jgi:hypothetical protein
MPTTKTHEELKKIVGAWRDDLVNNHVNRKSAALAEQANAALEDLAAQAELGDTDIDLDAWFEEYFHQPPVSHDTDFYNALHAAKEDLKAQIAA